MREVQRLEQHPGQVHAEVHRQRKAARRAAAQQLAQEWGPYIETCIEAFGPKRAMFESNFPVDEVSCDYPTLWNALKLSVMGASKDEKRELFFGTANRFYRLGL